MASMFRSTIKDDRGQEHPVINLRELKKSSDDPTSARRDLANYLKDAIHAESRRGGTMGWVVPLIFIFLGVACALVLARFGGGVVRTPFIPFIIIAIVIIPKLTKRRIGNQLASTIVAEGICGSCAYSLRSMAVEQDGCVVCAECGAAWKKIRITTPHWDRPPMPGPTKVSRWTRFFTSVPKDRDLLTADDRGRYVRALDSRLTLLPDDRRAELGRDEVRTMCTRLRSIGKRRRMCAALGLPLIMGALAAVFGDGSQISWMFAFSLVVTFAVLYGLPMYFGRNWLTPSKCVRLLADSGWCGSCGRGLETLPVEADGCVACRGCAASWRVAPPQTTWSNQSSPEP